MTQTTNRFFDEVARLMNDAAGVAQGVRREFDTMFRNQAERWLRDLDVVKREEFEAVKEMARLAREENEALKARIAALEAKLGSSGRTGQRLTAFSLSFRPPAAISPRIPRSRHPWRHIAATQGFVTMATVKEMKATARPKAGKGAARAERRAGRVPGVIYGDDKDPITISVDHAELKQRIYAGRFLTTIYELDVDGTKHRVIPRDFQLDPVRDLPVHVDFLRLGVGARIRVRIPVHILNADAVRRASSAAAPSTSSPTRSRCSAWPTTSRNRSTSIFPSSRSTIRSI